MSAQAEEAVCADAPCEHPVPQGRGVTISINPRWRYIVARALESGKRWRRHAACRWEDPELFFAASGEIGTALSARYDQAVAVCAACPVQRECLVDALLTEQARRYGIWGGTKPTERNAESSHELVVQVRAAIREFVGGEWVPNGMAVDHAAVLRRTEGEPVPLTTRDTRTAVVLCMKGGRTFEETAADLRMKVETVRMAWSRSQAMARRNGDPVPWKPGWAEPQEK